MEPEIRALRLVRVVHASRGRTRLRMAWLRESGAAARRIADDLADLPGMIEVRVRPFTGSVLCEHDPELLDEGRVASAAVDCVRRLSRDGELRVWASGSGKRRVEIRAARTQGSAVARAVIRATREIDADVLRATDGRVDLGALAALGFLAFGAAEIVTSRQLPAPPWFNLAWWAFRTFAVSEEKVMKEWNGEDRPTTDERAVRRQGKKAHRRETAG